MSINHIDEYIPSILNPQSIKKTSGNISTQNSLRSRCSLSLKRDKEIKTNNSYRVGISSKGYQNKENWNNTSSDKLGKRKNINLEDADTLCYSSIIDDFHSIRKINVNPVGELESFTSHTSPTTENELKSPNKATTILVTDKPTYYLSFSLLNSDCIDLGVTNSVIRNISFSHKDNDINVECEVMETSQVSMDFENSIQLRPTKRKAVSVNLEIKKQKLSTEDKAEENKVLILNTNAVEKLSHVIVQPSNYKLEERKFQDSSSKLFKSTRVPVHQHLTNEKIVLHCNLKQKLIDSYFTNVVKKVCCERLGSIKCDNDKINELVNKELVQDDTIKMNKNLCNGGTKHEASGHSTRVKNDFVLAEKATHRSNSPRIEIKPHDLLHSRTKNGSLGSYSPRKNSESVQFNLPVKSKSNKTSIVTKSIPWYKIVAGTHFAVDAFCYGEIPNVKHYFLTHFHSDHYSGLKKGFNKILYCSKITADLCISRLGVSSKLIKVLNLNDAFKIEGVEITAVDANHCPGAIMLVFTLPNGKSLLHTGDFRASPIMETYPIFWNNDIHTIYLDTTYCNPRYDFSTQDESLEMALFLLRQKKIVLEKAGKKFSSVLIVCGTYTIGKEKFFLGVSRRVGCSIWACPEKDRVLQIVEGRSFNHAPPQSCQLHVVPMKDLTHDKLQNYLDSLQGAFSEVVAFKPSGWENGKNSTVEKGPVTIHGIPYSEHSSFSEMIRFVKYLKPKQVVPTVDISGDFKSIEKYFPCPVLIEGETHYGSKVTDYFSIQARQQVPAVT